MKLFLKRVCFYLLFFQLPAGTLSAQFNPLNIPDNQLFKGYAREISGENISYHSFHPFANDALLTRVTDGNKIVEWETEDIPSNYKNKEAYFVWIAGYSNGTSAKNRHFELSINGEKVLTFTTPAKRVLTSWLVKGVNGEELFFQQKSIDNAGDVFGNMYLKIPFSKYKKGKPLVLKVTGEKAHSQDWYMTFKYEMKEKINIIPQPALIKNGYDTMLLIDVQIDHIKPTGIVTITTSAGKNPIKRSLCLGVNTIEVLVPKDLEDQNIKVTVSVSGMMKKEETLRLKKVHHREFDLISHSHNDIGYSDLQQVVERKQIKNIRDAMTLIKKSAANPTSSRYRWNVESLWAVENFMNVADKQEIKDFVRNVLHGNIALSASYANQLTGLCRPEDLVHLTDYSSQLQQQYGIHFNTIMISDIPGISWALIPALAQRGIKYISSGPNYVPSIPDLGDRVGNSDKAWGDKPFYWLSPSGNEKVLFWQAAKGYSWFHNFNVGRAGEKTKGNLMNYLRDLDEEKYPYDMVQLRYTIPADNGTTDSLLPSFVKNWNSKYISPKIVIANVNEMMEKFEKKYQEIIPIFSGDYSPYWEDGAASTARETGMIRRISERLNQAEILTTLLNPSKFDHEKFYQAWCDVVMFEEHTWGSWNSISDPDNPFTVSQWDYKKQFATDGEDRSEDLVNAAIPAKAVSNNFEVYNTSSWTRNDLIFLTKEQSLGGDVVFDENNKLCISQRCSDSSLVFLARDVPALSSKKYKIVHGSPSLKSDLKIQSNVIENGFIRIKIDTGNGSIASTILKKTNQELVDKSKNLGINQYLYVPGKDPSKAVSPKNISISIKENGPLIASLVVTSIAPGTENLTSEIRLVNGLNRIDLINTIDKLKMREKEGVNFAFPFNVPNGKMKIDLGIGILEPEKNQLEGSCKDFNCVQRWVDISNDKTGITWTTNEAPLIEIGELINEEPVNNGYKLWKKKTTLSNTFYSYVMNNYWHTNFKADQEGITSFHYSIFPHDSFNAAEANKRGLESSQPLLVAPANADAPELRPLFEITTPEIILSTIKPSKDKKGMIIRLYNSSDHSQVPNLKWKSTLPKYIFISNANEEKLYPFKTDKALPPFAFRTLLVEW
ncbi:MAG TPA: glycoside hydrolase family 38 C-terminal domain-containing protein [Hanamia sp.]|nr:glycoside hydrolase family 38 C-terminal domain-containing protein [Hanamia sp.]